MILKLVDFYLYTWQYFFLGRFVYIYQNVTSSASVNPTIIFYQLCNIVDCYMFCTQPLKPSIEPMLNVVNIVNDSSNSNDIEKA